MSDELIFPDLILFEEFGGNFKLYFENVYDIFENSFIKSQPIYNGLRVSAQKHPEVDGIHRTFYHITHEGEIENERKPDFRRMERIRFPKFCIDNCSHKDFLIWEKIGASTKLGEEFFLTFVLYANRRFIKVIAS